MVRAVLPPGLADAFHGTARLLHSRPLGSGLIHTTYLCTYQDGGRRWCYVHQRINPRVFPEPQLLMENVRRVTEHLHRRLRDQGVSDAHRRALSLIPTVQGALLWADGQGGWWRTYRYIGRSRTYDVAPAADVTRRAAAAYGDFVRRLADLPGPPLHETLPGFHDTPARRRALLRALEADACNRAGEASDAIEAVLARGVTAAALVHPELPMRVVHNDTKINNVLFDVRSGEALCVLDLDTVMPGLILHDFGDLARSAAAGPEDAAGGGAGGLSLGRFEALVQGYLEGTGDLLTPGELEHLALAPRVITLELAMRFLTDHLEGDRYFKMAHPGHNLERCRAQLRLLAEMEAAEAAMHDIVERARRDR